MLRPTNFGSDLHGRYGPLRLRPCAFRAFPSLGPARPRVGPGQSAAQLWQIDTKIVLERPRSRRCTAQPAWPCVGQVVVLLPTFDPNGQPKVERISPTEGVEQLRAHVLLDHDRGAPWLDLLCPDYSTDGLSQLTAELAWILPTPGTASPSEPGRPTWSPVWRPACPNLPTRWPGLGRAALAIDK